MPTRSVLRSPRRLRGLCMAAAVHVQDPHGLRTRAPRIRLNVIQYAAAVHVRDLQGWQGSADPVERRPCPTASSGPDSVAGRMDTADVRRPSPSARRPAAAGVCFPAAEDPPAACASSTAAHPGAADSPAPGSLEDRPGAAASSADPVQRRRRPAAAGQAVADAAERVARVGWEAGRVWRALALSWAATPRARCAAAAPPAAAGPRR